MKRENSNLEWIGFSLPELELIDEALSLVQEQYPDEAERAYQIKENIQYQLGNRSNPKPERKVGEEGWPLD